MLVLGGAAGAVIKTVQGKDYLAFLAVTETTAASTNSPVYVPLPGASLSVTVPANTTRTIDATFTAESRCTGQAVSSYCSARIVARNTTTGAVVELYPASAMDFAFDSVVSPDDFWEANAIERSRPLGSGTWRIEVEWAVTQQTTTFRLDDWHFAIEILSEPPVP